MIAARQLVSMGRGRFGIPKMVLVRGDYV
jgi:hypothetical protein